MSDALSSLRSLFQRALPMRIFGVEHSELSHNAMLHWLLAGGCGPNGGG